MVGRVRKEQRRVQIYQEISWRKTESFSCHSRPEFLKVILKLNVKLFMVRIIRMRSQMVSVGIGLSVRF